MQSVSSSPQPPNSSSPPPRLFASDADFAEASRVVAGGGSRDDAFYIDLLSIFFQEAYKRIKRIMDLVVRARARETTDVALASLLRDEAHGLKGSAGNLRLQGLASVSRNVPFLFASLRTDADRCIALPTILFSSLQAARNVELIAKSTYTVAEASSGGGEEVRQLVATSDGARIFNALVVHPCTPLLELLAQFRSLYVFLSCDAGRFATSGSLAEFCRWDVRTLLDDPCEWLRSGSEQGVASAGEGAIAYSSTDASSVPAPDSGDPSPLVISSTGARPVASTTPSLPPAPLAAMYALTLASSNSKAPGAEARSQGDASLAVAAPDAPPGEESFAPAGGGSSRGAQELEAPLPSSMLRGPSDTTQPSDAGVSLAAVNTGLLTTMPPAPAAHQACGNCCLIS